MPITQPKLIDIYMCVTVNVVMRSGRQGTPLKPTSVPNPMIYILDAAERDMISMLTVA